MRTFSENKSGNIAAIAALSLFAIAVGAGFALNVNRMETTADYIQRVADSAALGAVVVGQDEQIGSDQIVAAGQTLAASMLAPSTGWRASTSRSRAARRRG
jgi:N-acyl-L-homoserine lactone synthetase